MESVDIKQQPHTYSCVCLLCKSSVLFLSKSSVKQHLGFVHGINHHKTSKYFKIINV